MLKKIYRELVIIRKELQAIRSSKEPISLIHDDEGRIIINPLCHQENHD